MKHFTLPPRQGRMAAIAIEPLTPASYVRLRREAARMTVDQVAERLAFRAAFMADACALIRQLETKGATALHRQTLDALANIFPIDPNVYFQLRDEPADRHPRVCRVCGCSQWDPCDCGSEGYCAWSTDASCTRCAAGFAAEARAA